ncbi:bifunctional 23S rRNA (guanine(2069)-N(7))-methyltransferase RlmK/23S rRNA (guanine(2445)-N(2))-methyltransferase RlmL [Larsenimonas rhizosphaerae]|uniref:bifunctional 23S rRNA (guanine(2069)-N(7))-methyltransferase RlmK/23S rRNA (guanine(2445)-N(2))-methyltransferase RlmL n=1 Tax=Larsenimonas rhizosphaerae TaxID=2944682 RepID=UPI0020346036|nr:bifunctional 23S rRNA (guanine(2069)-N(7))-methyltransferase RlmK/23S rRNA (guanine(2445)-N(2))-methyltransferase RlmL [Larsenimonas rhizosphaerae]MCM2132037.1 bifunctional 23S rRNA (guanine(2069)-N(7))-methyltransferase RlmK/23S rRNA (guanine(2445)-N(2))-methyltransferase RlmL [Larsenimonas rhizosphaerae]
MKSDVPPIQYDYCVTCPWGLEGLLEVELGELGAEVVRQAPASVFVRAPLEIVYGILLRSRLANRVIVVLGQFEADGGEGLTEASAEIPWETILLPGKRLRVDFHGRTDQVRHTMFGAQCIKDGIVDRWMRHFDTRPEIDPKHADSRIYAHLHRGRLTLGLDLSGDSLHMRGYRLDGAQAPLKENLAAALLFRAGWPAMAEHQAPLIDPLCGSGTLVIEAAMMAVGAAPNAYREFFGCENWAAHDEALWEKCVTDARTETRRNIKHSSLKLLGFDRDAAAIDAARNNAKRAGVSSLVEFSLQPVEAWTPEATSGTPGLVMTNPPYGERLGDIPELIPLYAALGHKTRQLGVGWKLAVFTGNPELGHRLGLRAHKRYNFRNGALECKLLICPIEEAQVQPAGETSAPQEDAQAAAPVPGEQAQMLINRLVKNRRQLSKWLRKSGVTCYRLYDADMPEFAVAVDVYDQDVHIQEYAPPRNIDPRQAERRLMDAVAAVTQVMEVSPERVHLKTRQRQSGTSQYERQSRSRHALTVTEGEARFKVNLRDFLDTGVFLDHRPARRWVGEHASGKRVLNLFCYTATATVHAALGGARESVSVDMSNTYLEWAEENYRLNRLDLRRHTLERADCMDWLATARGEYDLIFMDPPTFSNSKKMRGVLDIQRDHVSLIDKAMKRLSPMGTLLFSNNLRRFKLDPDVAERFAVTACGDDMLDPDFKRRPNIHHVFMIRHRLNH